jgi:hypothetical protein
MSRGQATGDRTTGWLPAREVDWDAAYKDQLPRGYNYLRFRIGNEADAEELTSRTSKRPVVAGSCIRDLAGFSTWLFTIAQNVAVDHLRSSRTHLPLEAALEAATVHTSSRRCRARFESRAARRARGAPVYTGPGCIVDTFGNIQRLEKIIQSLDQGDRTCRKKSANPASLSARQRKAATRAVIDRATSAPAC